MNSNSGPPYSKLLKIYSRIKTCTADMRRKELVQVATLVSETEVFGYTKQN